ncbi:MAG: hypothetical protein JZD40_07230, partial [Sulfolobus sp.]|nr:hypothetical protein [Sulfolobus sp.]
SLDKVVEVERMRMPFYVEDFVREILGRVTNGDPNYYLLRKEKGKVYEVNIVVKDRKRVKVIAEVKWRGEVTRRDLEGMYVLGSSYENAKKIVVVPSKSVVKGDLGEVEVVTPEDLLNGM